MTYDLFSDDDHVEGVCVAMRRLLSVHKVAPEQFNIADRRFQQLADLLQTR